jgi:hypothetical protein
MTLPDKFTPLLFADDTSFIVADGEETKFQFHANEMFKEINKWFYSNLLMLNYDKTSFMQFAAKTGQEMRMQVFSGD